jgi:hypothetical protein
VCILYFLAIAEHGVFFLYKKRAKDLQVEWWTLAVEII